METIAGGIILAHLIQGAVVIALLLLIVLGFGLYLGWADRSESPEKAERKKQRVLADIAQQNKLRARRVADLRAIGYTDEQLRRKRLIY